MIPELNKGQKRLKKGAREFTEREIIPIADDYDRKYQPLHRGEACVREASMAKAFCTETAIGVTYKAVQIHGAYGTSEGYPVERYFRDARSLTFPDGVTQIQKLIIGREMLGISAFI